MGEIMAHITDNPAEFLAQKAFSYLSQDEKKEVFERLKSDSFGVSFNCEPPFHAVVQVCPDCIHVHEAGGNFLSGVRSLKYFCQGLARYFGVSEITFNATRKYVAWLGERQGFQKRGHEYAGHV